MQIDPLQGPLLAMLVRIIGAQRVLEVGTFTGLSSLWMAQAMGEDGELVCCDLSAEYTSLAKEAWAEAGVEDRIELIIGPALETLTELNEPFDLVFLDADKGNYPKYLELLKRLVLPGGIIVVDNTLWSGRVLEPAESETDTWAIQQFNQLAHDDDDLTTVVLPIADGMSILQKNSLV